MPRLVLPALLVAASLTAGSTPADAREASFTVEGGRTRAATIAVPADCTVVGTGESDTLVGTSGTDVLCGLGGDDVLVPNGGSDVVVGGPGIDLVSYAGTTTKVQVDLATGIATTVDTTTELVGVEGARGSTKGDTLWGNAKPNVFAGLGGDDSIDGRGGIDTADYSVCAGARCEPRAITVDLATHTASGIGNGTDQIRHVENAYGSPSGGDVLTGNGAANWLYGFGGADVLRGLAGNDYLGGGEGNDRLDGGAGDDFLDGNLGTDRCAGGTGIDALVGCP